MKSVTLKCRTRVPVNEGIEVPSAMPHVDRATEGTTRCGQYEPRRLGRWIRRVAVQVENGIKRNPKSVFLRAVRKAGHHLPYWNLHFAYGQDWYDEVYHPLLTEGRDFETYLSEWSRHEYRARLEAVFPLIRFPEGPMAWLEVCCMQGKSAYWFLKNYPNARMYMFDFSRSAVEWVQEHFPREWDWEVWQGDIQEIGCGGRAFDDFFDVVTCLDVTEHLPAAVYKNAIHEMYRVLKPTGQLILMQGNTPLPEHINVLPEEQLVADFRSAGFKLVENLPHRHYLLTKEPPLWGGPQPGEHLDNAAQP